MKKFLLILISATIFVASISAQKTAPVAQRPVTPADFQRIVQPVAKAYEDAQRETISTYNAYKAASAMEEIARRDRVDAINALKTASGIPLTELAEWNLSQVKDANGNVTGLEFVKTPSNPTVVPK